MVAVGDGPARSTSSRYEFKPEPYSSHSLLLKCFPQSGSGRTILDVGCDKGEMGATLAARGFQVTGIEMPGCAPAGFPESVRLIEADLDAGLPSLAGRFDYILCADVLEHLREPGALLEQLRAALAPGGELIASLPNSGNIYFRLNVLAGRFPQHERGLFDRTHLRFYTWRGWVDLFRGAGFAIRRVRPSTTAIPVGHAFPRWRGNRAMLAAEALCYIAGRLWKKMFAYQFVIIARASGAGA